MIRLVTCPIVQVGMFRLAGSSARIRELKYAYATGTDGWFRLSLWPLPALVCV
jgi:hypothetical protein